MQLGTCMASIGTVQQVWGCGTETNKADSCAVQEINLDRCHSIRLKLPCMGVFSHHQSCNVDLEGISEQNSWLK